MTEVGTAYVSLLVSARGISQQVSREMGSAGSDGGAAASKGFLASTASLVGKTVGIATGAVAAIGGLIGGLAIKGGIARQLQIEDATAKLTGLGNSTQTVKAIMDNALASVKGTAFGMGEAATVAAGATAAGIKPGLELERVLKLTADAATIAGTDMGTMGSIFNKVAASGKLQGDVIAQLQDAGVPILQMVAKEMGVTAAEASKMASDGKVSFETFANAMESGLGGAALKSGDTTTGAWKNMLAAFSRFGVTLTSGIFPLIKDGFNAVGTVVDALGARIKPAAEAFGKWFGGIAGTAVSGFAANAETAFDKIGSVITSVWAKIQPAMTEIKGGFIALWAGLMAGGSDVTSGGFAGILESVGLALRNLWDAFGPMAEQAGGLGDIVDAFSPMGIIMAALAPVLPQLAVAAGQLAGVFAGALTGAVTALLPLITDVTTVIADIVTGFMDTEHGAGILAGIIASLGAGFLAYKVTMAAIVIGTQAWTAAQEAYNVVANLNPIGLIIAGIVALIAIIVLLVMNWDTVVGFLKGIWDGFVGWFTGIMDGFLGWWGGVWDGFMGFLTDVWSNITSFLKTALSIALDLFLTWHPLGIIIKNWGVIVEFFKGIWNNIVAGVTGFVAGFVAAFQSIVTFLQPVIDVFVAMFGAFGAIFGFVFALVGFVIRGIVMLFQWWLGMVVTILTGIWTFIVSVWTSITDAIGAAVGFIGGLISTAFNIYIGIVVTVLTAIWSFITTIWNNISSFIGTVLGAIGGFMSSAWNGFIGMVSGPLNAVWGFITSIWNNVVGFLGVVLRTIGSIVSNAWNSVASTVSIAVGMVYTSVVNKFNEVVSWLGGIGGRILGAMGNLGGLLVNAGRSILEGLLSGLKDMWNNVAGFFQDLTSKIPDWKGPADRDKTLLTNAGHLIMGGFLNGLESQYGAVQKSLGGFTDSLSADATIGGNLSISKAPAYAGDVSYGGTAGGGGLTYSPTYQWAGDDPHAVMARDKARMRDTFTTYGIN